jgi:Xaa-Pro aminopeptidase
VTGAVDVSVDDLTTPLPPLSVAGRLDRLRAALAAVETAGDRPEAMVVTTPANVRWLTGFTGSAGVLVVTGDHALLATDGRYRTQAAEQLAASGVAADVDLCIGGVVAQREALAAAASTAAAVGLEAGDVTWAAVHTWEEVLGPRPLVATHGVVEGLRVVKDAAEVTRMERAAAIADAALGAVLPLLHRAAGGEELTESAFAAALDHAMRTHGAEDRAFETIVASGENSAKPHARPGQRLIRPGDPVVVDFGATFDGYRSDMTRTFCVGGAPTGELATVFAVVAESQVAGVDAVAPGVATGDVDKVCRDRIAAAGWAEQFEHGTGHGVGLDIHEGPAVGAGSTAILQAGIVVTVEPGVYLPVVGGVRIEDTLVVTDTGSRPLTRFPKDVPV